MENKDLEKKYRPWVITASIAIPLVVAALFGIKIEGVDFSFLPPIYATLNGITAIVLILAVVAIKRGNKNLHQRLVQLAILCSLLFLVGYIAYHITSSSTLYGDTNHDGIRSLEEAEAASGSFLIYICLLVSHIVLSILVIPLVLNTYVKGWLGNVESHRKWAKITFPIWLYVAVSGVVVYLMISPFYG
ncbi:MAG: DUF420 domain-containing protein [Crocinitomicaceae bacterium]|nr:DUF420 domain-containing protein [Crocinitomicaceae bacterium]